MVGLFKPGKATNVTNQALFFFSREPAYQHISEYIRQTSSKYTLKNHEVSCSSSSNKDGG